MSIQDSNIKNLIANNTIAQLLRLPKDAEVSAADVEGITDALWTKQKAEMKADPVRIAENNETQYTYPIGGGNNATSTVRAIEFNGKTMRFTVEKKGAKPANGYPLVISLHGGGQTSAEANNQQWQNQQVIWGKTEPVIYLCPRAIEDTWNCHFVPDAYPMYDRIIENMIAFEDADPNRIMLMGFSAGGDGVYQITPRMADRFSATNMMAGHPNGVSVANNRNTAFLIGMGALDSSYSRNTEAAKYDGKLNTLQAADPGGYTHDAFIFPNGTHNNWIPNTVIGNAPQPSTILADPVKWLSGNNTTKQVNTQSITWMNQYERGAMPSTVVFDSTTRANSRQGVNSTTSQRLWPGIQRAYQAYWVNIGANAADYGEVNVSTTTATNTVNINSMGNFVQLFLHPNLLDLTKPVNVQVGGETLRYTPHLTLKTMVRSLVDRCDPKMVFPANLIVEKTSAGYSIVDQGLVTFGNTVGGYGTPFQDNPPAGAKLTTLNMRHGDVLDNIQATYGHVAMPAHGGPGGGLTTINLASDEHVMELNGTSGYYFGARHIVQLYIKTNKNTYGPFGTKRFATSLQPFTLTPPTGQKIVAFKGSTLRHTDGTDFVASLGIGSSFEDGGTSQTADGSGTGEHINVSADTPAIFTASLGLTRPVADVNVMVNLTASQSGNLKLELVSPQGTHITLYDQNAEAGSNFDHTIFDDQATNSLSPTAPSGSRSSYKPVQPLAGFIGESPSGDWQLLVTDSATGDVGLMHNWQLFVTTF